jgi:hypothetical protein
LERRDLLARKERPLRGRRGREGACQAPRA